MPGAAGRPDPGEEEPEVIVDPGNGPDRGAGIFGGGLLLDGDGGGEPLDGVHVRLLHDAGELPGVGREGLRRTGAGLRHRGYRTRALISRSRRRRLLLPTYPGGS